MSPDANAVLTMLATDFGTKLNDPRLASVWAYFFEKKLADFDNTVLNFYIKGRAEYVKEFELFDVEQERAFKMLANHSETIIRKVFVGNVEETVLSSADLNQHSVTLLKIKAFFAKFTPRADGFDEMTLGK